MHVQFAYPVTELLIGGAVSILEDDIFLAFALVDVGSHVVHQESGLCQHFSVGVVTLGVLQPHLFVVITKDNL